LGISVIKHEKKKPEVKEDILRHFGITEEIAQQELAMIGDRVLADTVMGNTHGYYTIDVEPFSTEKENFMVKFMRKVEAHFIPIITPN
jgi:predicted HAD superfamily phosphohydrolase YqeG